MNGYQITLEDFSGNLNPEIEITYTDNNRVRCTFMSKCMLTGKYRCFPFRPEKEFREIKGDLEKYRTYLKKYGFNVKEIKTYEY